MTTADTSRFFEILAVAVAGGSTVRSAAESIGCPESTAYHFSASPEFRQRVAQLRSDAVTQAVGSLSAAACQAVATLIQLLDESNEPSVRLNASKAILANLGPLSELGELRARLDALEAAR